MKFIGSALLVFLVVLATASAAGLGGLLDEKRPPFAKDDEVQYMMPQLTKEIRERISENLVNDKVAKASVKDAPIEVLSYRSQVVAGFNYFVRVKVASYFFQLSIYRNTRGDTLLQEVKGPLAEDAPFKYTL